jgi:hypothetical protein
MQGGGGSDGRRRWSSGWLVWNGIGISLQGNMARQKERGEVAQQQTTCSPYGGCGR